MSNLPDREKSRNLRSLRFAFAFLRPYGGRLLLSGVALLFTAGVTLSLGFGLRYMIDHGFATGSLEALNQAILQFVGLAFLMAGGTFIRHYLVSWLGERVSADIRKAVFARVIELNPSFFETNVTGEIQTRITTDTSILQSVIGSSASIALRNAIMFVGGVAAMFVTDPMLTGIVLVCVPLAIGPILFFGRQVRRHARNSQDRLAEVGAYVGEALRGIKTVQANNHQELDRRKFNERVEEAFSAVLRVIRYRSFLITIVIALSLGAVGFMLRVAGAGVIETGEGAGKLVQFVFYAFLVASSVGQLSEILGDLQRAAGATERLAELFQARNTIQPPKNPAQLTRAYGELRLDSVRFTYATRPQTPALHSITFHITAGSTFALVGPSGAGKSTLFDLLLRFYDPDAGGIYLDSQDIRNLHPTELRRYVGIVPQEPVLFSTSLLENIRYGRPDASEAEAYRAMQQACVTDFLHELPEGMHTYLGESGVRLSGGQKQRVAIARAILKDPRLLLLDEATSALDAHSENRVQQALNALMQNRTTLVIAHRLATVLHADRILVIDSGRIIDQGTHRELMQTSDLYRRLADLQFQAGERAMRAP